MWQDFKDFITIDNLHIFCFWFLIILTVVGLIEIIYQIRNAVRKINIADEYIKHIDIIQKHVAKRLHARKQYGFVDTKDLIEIEDGMTEMLPHIAIRYLLIMKKGERNFKRC